MKFRISEQGHVNYQLDLKIEYIQYPKSPLILHAALEPNLPSNSPSSSIR